MDIQETRRERLRKWVEEHGVPPKEKSYFSQLLSKENPASFGERSARRLERDYDMPAMFLDAAESGPVASTEAANTDSLKLGMRMLELFSLLDAKGQQSAIEFLEAQVDVRANVRRTRNKT